MAHQGRQNVLWKEVEITAVGSNSLINLAGGLKGTKVV